MVAKMQQEASQAGKSPAQIAKEKQREAESKAKAQEQAHKQQVAERLCCVLSFAVFQLNIGHPGQSSNLFKYRKFHSVLVRMITLA